MYRFMNIRIGAISVLIVILLLCFLTESSFAVIIVPINGNEKTVEPGPTPYWELGEEGMDPHGRITTSSSSGACVDLVDSRTTDATTVSRTFNHEIEFMTILKILILNIHFSSFHTQTLNSIWRQ